MTKKTENIYFAFIASILFFLSCFLHLYDLETMPSGMHVDEASVAYNAYSISETGADEHGVKIPVFFKSFSNYQDPILIYTIVPFVEFFGFSKAVVRMPSAVYHILAAIALFFLSSRLIEDKWISLFSAFIFSLLPWIFPVSRTCIGGYTPLLFGTVCGIYFLIDFISKKTTRSVVFASLSWAFAFYSHHPGRPMSVIILLCFIISFNKILIKQIRQSVIFILLLFLLLTPMAISMLQIPHALTTRFNAISVWRDNPGFIEVVLRIIHRYIEYFGPQFLFISGDSNYAHSTQRAGALYTFMAPFVLVGAYNTVKRIRTDSHSLFLSLLTLSYPAAAMLTIGHRHGTACIGGSIYWALLSGIGFKIIFYKIKTFSSKALFLAIVLSLSSLEMAFYFKDYFSAYRESSRWIFGANLYEALEKAVKLREKDEPIYISRYVFFPETPNHDFKPEFYAIILFLTKLDPITYHEEGIPNSLVSLYDYEQTSKGILVRLDSLVLPDADGQFKQIKDYEPVPNKMTLLDARPTPSGISIEIYRMGK